MSRPNVFVAWFSGCILLLFSIFGGCNNNDRSGPKLSISLPADEVTLQAGTDLLIEGSVSDKQGLASLTFSLTEPSGIVYQSQENALSGVEMDFSFVFSEVGDLQTETGSYSIKVTARDVNGNETSEFIPAQINEIPQKLYKTFLGVADPQENYELVLRDTFGNLSTQMALGNQLSVFQVDNYQQQFFTASRFAGVFKGYRTDDFAVNWTETIPSGSGSAIFTDLYRTRTDYYMGLGIAPFGRIYGVDGSLTLDWNNLINPVNALYFQQNRIYTSESAANGQTHRLAAYSLQSQDLVQIAPLDWAAVDLLPLNEIELLVIGNEGNSGRIYIINRSTFAITEDYDLTSPVTAATLGPDAAFLATASGVRKLDRDNYTLGTIYPGDFLSIAYEPTSGRIYLGKEDGVEIISENGTFISEITGITGKVNFIDFHMNK